MGERMDITLAILNGTVGDYLARTHNALATPMAFMHHGHPLSLTADALHRALPGLTTRVVVLVHGLMCTESVWRFPDGMDYGSMLARDLGFTPLYVRYNSGLAIADNGAALSALMDAVMTAWPVPLTEVLLVGYSMGGLVVRAACHTASVGDAPWLDRVRKAIYVGTPHLGAPAERVGRLVTRVLHGVDDPTTRLIADIASLRSQGLRDLGDADLRPQDRVSPAETLRLGDRQHPVPLLPGVVHHLVAGALSDAPWLKALFGDAVVPVRSATAGSAQDGEIPPERVRVITGANHVALAHHPAVYAAIRAWCEGAA